MQLQSLRPLIAMGLGAVLTLGLSDRLGSQPNPEGSEAIGQPEPVEFQDPPAPPRPEDDLAEFNPSPDPLLFPILPEEVKTQPAPPLTLTAALALALDNNTTLELAKLRLQRSQAALREQKAARFPNLTLLGQGQLQDSFDDVFNSEGNTATFPNRTVDTDTANVGGNIRLDYDLFGSGGRSASIKGARRQVRLNELVVEQQTEQIRLDVITAYYTLQNADEQVRIAEAGVVNAERSLKDAQVLERVGLGTRFDILRTEVQLANQRQTLTNALANQKTAQRRLAATLNLSQTAQVRADDPVVIAGEWALSLEESIVLAYKNRSELEQQLVQRELDELQRRVALAAVRPQVSVFSQFSLSHVSNSTNSSSASAITSTLSSDTFSRNASLGVQVRWNFYDGGAARARAKQRSVDKAIAEVTFAETRNQIRFQVEESFFELESNQTNIETSTKALDQAKESLRLARLRFQAGVGTQTDVIDAETELTRAEGNLVAAIVGYNQALANLERAISNLPTQSAPTQS